MKLHAQILTGLVAGVAAGALCKLPGLATIQRVVIAIEPAGTVFIKLITMVVVPLVVASLFVGVASLGDARRLGRIGGKTLAYFAATTLAAAIIGTTVALAAGVGGGLTQGVRDSLTSQFGEAGQGAAQAISAVPTFLQTIVALVPQNPFAAAAAGELLPLIVAVCAFGAAATVTDTDGSRAVVRFFSGVNDLAMIIVGWLMRLAPIAVFVLIAAMVARTGFDLLQQLVMFALVVVLALVL
ncbi:MAG TPA: cation:dicarboxylase symporter family transporter, partial [Gemmatimonadaceae bacterium]|nr:cation:dicarboxylase symporter family transporter [Gemmatimonadaceae bacterium]